MAATKINRPSGGQGLIEFVVVLPLLVTLGLTITFLMIGAQLRLELQGLTQELKVCYASTHSQWRCQSRYRAAVARLPGHFRLRGIDEDRDSFTATLSSELPLSRRNWQIQIRTR